MRSLSILVICCLYVLTFTQDCQNPLLSVFGLQGLDAPQDGSALPFCNYLKTAQACCSADTVQTFQDTANNLTQRLQAYAASRDQYLSQLNISFLIQYQDVYYNLTDFEEGINYIQENTPDIGNELRAQFDILGSISTTLNGISTADFDTLLTNYQQARVNCFTTVLQVQASAYCLACDPYYATTGVFSDGTIAFSEGLCGTISAACAPFVAASDSLSPLFRAQQTYNRLVDLTTFMYNFTYGGLAIPNYLIDGDIFIPTNATEQTNTLPLGCDGANCPWQCQNLFINSNVLNEVVVANGAGLIGGGDIVLAPVGVPGAPIYPPPPAPVVVVVPDNTTVIIPTDSASTVTTTTNAEAASPDAASPDVVSSDATSTDVASSDAASTNSDGARFLQNPAPEDPAIPPTPALPALPGVWAPDLTNSGILIVVIADPGNVFAVPEETIVTTPDGTTEVITTPPDTATEETTTPPDTTTEETTTPPDTTTVVTTVPPDTTTEVTPPPPDASTEGPAPPTDASTEGTDPTGTTVVVTPPTDASTEGSPPPEVVAEATAAATSDATAEIAPPPPS